MLPDSVEFLLNYGNTHFDRNEISMNHEFAIRFHSKCVERTYTPRRVPP